MPSDTNPEHLLFVEDPDLLVEHFGLDVEYVRELQSNWRGWLIEVGKEWTPEKLKEWVLTKKREQYAYSVIYIKDLERKNHEARTNGVSYKEREEKYGSKIRMGYRVLEQYKQEGRAMKSQTYTVTDYIRPHDYTSIMKDGIEKHLKYAIF